jgi:hypothetical protein
VTTADSNPARLIDTYAHTFDTTETRMVLVDAHPATVLGGVERLELARTVVHAIEAVGLADRLALAPTRLDAGAATNTSTEWRGGSMASRPRVSTHST